MSARAGRKAPSFAMCLLIEAASLLTGFAIATLICGMNVSGSFIAVFLIVAIAVHIALDAINGTPTVLAASDG